MGPTGTGKPGYPVVRKLKNLWTLLGKSTVSTFQDQRPSQPHLYPLQFIKLLSNNDIIRIGHNIESETIDINTASYSESGRVVTLVDTPGFDDSREGVTDTDILEKVAKFLQEG